MLKGGKPTSFDEKDVVEVFKGNEVSISLNLNLGSGFTPMDGEMWENADFNPSSPADFHFDFREQWPIRTNKYDCVLAVHTLEHFSGEELFLVMWEIGRVLKPGGCLVAVVPHGLNEVHYSNPFHKMGWTEGTPENFNKTRYIPKDTASTGANQMKMLHPWKVVTIELALSPEWSGKPQAEVDFAVKHYLNVVQEMSFVMRLEEK